MAVIRSFSTLIEAISRSIAEAQDQFERHQVSNLLSYFDENLRPRGLEFRVPSMRSDAKPGEEDFYVAPFLALLPANALKIKDVKIDFSVDLGELTEVEDTTPLAPDTKAASAQARLSVSPMKAMGINTITGKSGGRVKVVLRVEGTEPSEGAARLVDYLAHSQGVYKKFVESSSDSPSDKKEPGK